MPEDADAWFRRQRSVQRRRGAAQKEGYTAAQVSNLNPEFQTLASLLKTGNEEVRCEAQEQYWEHLIDLYIMRSSETGDIDYGYLSNRLERFWHDFKATKNSRVASSGWMGPEAS